LVGLVGEALSLTARTSEHGVERRLRRRENQQPHGRQPRDEERRVAARAGHLQDARFGSVGQRLELRNRQQPRHGCTLRHHGEDRRVATQQERRCRPDAGDELLGIVGGDPDCALERCRGLAQHRVLDIVP
jgi:hypothetical protein